MAVNKVVINDAVVLDLTGDTVRAADLPKGVIAHSATGAKVTGTTNYAGSSNAGGSATSAEKLNNSLTIRPYAYTKRATELFVVCNQRKQRNTLQNRKLCGCVCSNAIRRLGYSELGIQNRNSRLRRFRESSQQHAALSGGLYVEEDKIRTTNHETFKRRRPAPLAPGPAHYHRGLALQ